MKDSTCLLRAIPTYVIVFLCISFLGLASESAQAQEQADLAVSTGDSPDPVQSGSPLSYTVVVSNNGPDTSEDILLMVVTPDGFQLTGVEGSPEWDCSAVQQLVACVGIRLLSGQTLDVTLSGSAVLPQGGTISLFSLVDASTEDPVLDNDFAQEETTVQPNPTPTPTPTATATPTPTPTSTPGFTPQPTPTVTPTPVPTLTPTPTPTPLPLVPPVITSPEDGADVPTCRPTLEGTSASGNAVEILDGDKPIGAAIVNTGIWSFTPTSTLRCGEHTFRGLAFSTRGEKSDPSEPVTVYLKDALVLPFHFLWNGYLGMSNVLSLYNTASQPQTLTLYLLDHDGNERSQQTMRLEPDTEFDVLVNELSGFALDAVGSLRVEGPGQGIEANGMFYRFTAQGSDNPTEAALRPEERLEFIRGTALKNSLSGECFALVNTVDPSKGSSRLYLVPNWFALASLDEQASRRFTVQFYGPDGQLLDSEATTVPVLGRRDIEAGHARLGNGRVALLRVVPEEDSNQYTGELSRFGMVDPAGNAFSFAATSSCRGGSAEVQYVPISRGHSSESWVIVANVGESPARVLVQRFDNQGTALGEVSVLIPEYGQVHILASEGLGEGLSGVARLSPEPGSSIIAESNVYFYDASGLVSAAYASESRPVRARANYSSYNTFLGQFNWLRLFNTASGDAAVSIDTLGSQTTGAEITLQTQAGIDYPIHHQSTAPAADTYGILRVITSPAGTVFEELVRVQYEDNGESVSAAESLPVR